MRSNKISMRFFSAFFALAAAAILASGIAAQSDASQQNKTG